jgi:porphobilinogen deaminase
VPVGCFSKTTGDHLFLTGFVASMDGEVYLLETESGTMDEPKATGERLAKITCTGCSKNYGRNKKIMTSRLQNKLYLFQHGQKILPMN